MFMTSVIISTTSHRQSVERIQDAIWAELGGISISHAVETFLATLKLHTKKAYKAAFNIFFTRGILNPEMSLQMLSLSNLENLLDLIRNGAGLAEASKQSRAAVFVSFCGFLARRTGGIVRKVALNREKGNKTFRRLRSKAATEALSIAQWNALINVLQSKNSRDALIAQMLLQGAKRISEVLEADIGQINWEKGTITFRQLKTEQQDKATVIHYPQSFLSELKRYLNGRTAGLIFITKNGKAVLRHQIWLSFAGAGIDAGIGKVSPHQLRASAITWLREKNFSAEEIQKVSGHESIEMVIYYDKSKAENNPTSKITLI
jgi:integrase